MHILPVYKLKNKLRMNAPCLNIQLYTYLFKKGVYTHHHGDRRRKFKNSFTRPIPILKKLNTYTTIPTYFSIQPFPSLSLDTDYSTVARNPLP